MTEILTPETALAAMPLVSPAWLGVREAADAAARSADLVDPAAPPPRTRAGWRSTTSAAAPARWRRWLAPLLPGPQHWVMYDRDPDLLAAATCRRGRHRGDPASATSPG